MKNLLWLIAGIGAGFVVAHEVNKTQRGKEFFADLDLKLKEFSDTVADAYKEREAELRDAIDDIARNAEDTLGDLNTTN